jgi:hypothetical protein
MRIKVSIRTPNAFSMRSAISPERSALPIQQRGKSGPGHLERFGRVRDGEADRLYDLGADEIAGVGWIF